MTYDQYMKGVHKIGTFTMLGVLVMTFVPAFYVWIVYDCFPTWNVVTGCILAMIAQEGLSCIMGPLFSIPLYGITGEYMAATAGNGMTMRLPVSIASQNAVKAQRGTEKAEMASTIGMASSVFLNLFVLFLVLICGNWILSILPPVITDSFDYAVAAIMGGLIPMFFFMFTGGKKKTGGNQETDPKAEPAQKETEV